MIRRGAASRLRGLQAGLIAACAVCLLLVATASLVAQSTRTATWRTATAEELRSVIPQRAPVLAERVETESTSASGIVSSDGRFIAAAVLITAGYSANGKYSDYLVTQVPLKIEGKVLPPGGYLLGWVSSADGLQVTFSEATTGRVLLQTLATKNPLLHRVEQIRIWPPPQQTMIQLGRFELNYTLP